MHLVDWIVGCGRGPSMRRVLRSPLLAVAAIGVLLGAARVEADPCCVSQICQNLTPQACTTASGISGYCNVGAACSAPTCNAPAIVAIAGVKGAKANAAQNVHFSWIADPNADRYNTSYVNNKRDIAACTGCLPVVGSSPSTIPESLHVGGVPGAGGTVNYYVMTGGCGAGADGACCNGITCTMGSQAACGAAGGIFQGSGTACSPTSCLPTGSCCTGAVCAVTTQANCGAPGTWTNAGVCNPNPCVIGTNGSCCVGTTCSVTTQQNCTGTWTSGGTCAPDPCVTGACCVGMTCTVGTRAQCTAMSSAYQGDNSACSPATCAGGGVGACCDLAGCTQQSQASCTASGGTFSCIGQVCSASSCATATGGCCSGLTCSVATDSACLCAGGTYQGDGIPCAPANPCNPTTGACCVGLTCTDNQSLLMCNNAGGRWVGANSNCATTPCSSGACCNGSTCTVTIASDCAAAGCNFLGLATTCVTNACDPGGCCLPTTGCQVLMPGQCTAAGGTYTGPGACAPNNPCVGACCTGAGCLGTDLPNCTAAGGTFRGIGTTCPPVIPCNATGACCRCTTGCSDNENAVNCGGSGGTYQGDNSTCRPVNPCAATQGCCVGGNCQRLNEAACQAAGGVSCGCMAGGPC